MEVGNSAGRLTRVARWTFAGLLGVFCLVYDLGELGAGFFVNPGATPLPIYTFIALVSGLLLWVTWRQELREDRSILPTAVLAAATFIALLSLVGHSSEVAARKALFQLDPPWDFLRNPSISIGLILFFTGLVFAETRQIWRAAMARWNAKALPMRVVRSNRAQLPDPVDESPKF